MPFCVSALKSRCISPTANATVKAPLIAAEVFSDERRLKTFDEDQDFRLQCGLRPAAMELQLRVRILNCKRAHSVRESNIASLVLIDGHQKRSSALHDILQFQLDILWSMLDAIEKAYPQ